MKYEVKVGIDFIGANGKPRRAEAGELVEDIPKASLKWLLEQGIIAEPDKPKKDGEE